MKAILSALVLSAALVAAGCGSSGSSSSGSGSGSSGGAPAATSSGKTIQVTMQNIAFNPSTTTAKVGQTITWTNRDSVAHNVTATKGDTFKSKTLNQGDSYSYKADKPGTITYVCTFHPGMQATITVTK